MVAIWAVQRAGSLLQSSSVCDLAGLEHAALVLEARGARSLRRAVVVQPQKDEAVRWLDCGVEGDPKRQRTAVAYVKGLALR